ncbi:MAG: hypothetical protein ABJB69_05415 [Spartobacteria bacterium]
MRIRTHDRLEDDVRSTMETNGEVTLPGLRRDGMLLTKSQRRFAFVIIGAFLLLRFR